MEGLILGVNTLYRLFCFFKLFPMVGKGLKQHSYLSFQVDPNTRLATDNIKINPSLSTLTAFEHKVVCEGLTDG